MAGWDEVLQGEHLSPPIEHLSLTQEHRAECPLFTETQREHTHKSSAPLKLYPPLNKRLSYAYTCKLSKVCMNLGRASTFSNLVSYAENLGQLRDGFVEDPDLYFHITWNKPGENVQSHNTLLCTNSSLQNNCMRYNFTTLHVIT